MKSNVIPLASGYAAYGLEEGLVKAAGEHGLLVECGAGLLSAARAFGCAVAPAAGDRVLLGRSDRQCYVLTVLERPTEAPAVMEFAGDVQIRSRAGAVTLCGQTEVQLMAGETLSLAAPTLEATAARTELHSSALAGYCGEARLHADDTELQTARLSVSATDILQRARRVVRWVEEVETATIGNLMQLIRQVFSMNANDAVVTAKRDMKLDGERIHMG